MSIQFDKPMSKETEQRLKQMFGASIAVIDDRNVLLENLTREIKQKEMSAIAKEEKQPITLNIHHEIGDIVEMSDGTKYEVTEKGWKKVQPRG